MYSIPGVFTATECFDALDSGADALKIFPASLLKEENFKALKQFCQKILFQLL